MSNGFSEKFHDPLLFEKYLPGQYRYEGSAEEGKSATGTLYLPQEVVRDNSAQVAAGGDAAGLPTTNGVGMRAAI